MRARLLAVGCLLMGGLAGCGGDGSASREQLINGCAYIAACMPGELSLEGCVYGDKLWPEAQLACAIDAKLDCDAVLSCVGVRRDPDSTCTEHCEGNIRVTCRADAWRYDCGVWPYTLGDVCVEDGNSADCVTGTCSTDTGGWTCNGNSRSNCNGAQLREWDCGQLSCYDGECLSEPPIVSCANSGDIACDGDVLVRCEGGVEKRIDCSTLGLSCYFEMDPSGSLSGCMPVGPDCNPFTSQSLCDGTTIQFCDAGHFASVDCGALGFTGCDSYGCVP